MADPKDEDRSDEAGQGDQIEEQKAVEHTEETGEIDPSGLWPEGDEETRTPV